ncbi:hypothetical protein EGW08_010600 [Elysia chlorotica]|uniref:Uncharacterized protein n=1 Tax=Elysia chlorotica TaxID=188477 RepID=A0A433TJ71_ELYCH|nr:hypothetical protein EGW08_010600 [Elysia chlorotica]
MLYLSGPGVTPPFVVNVFKQHKVRKAGECAVGRCDSTLRKSLSLLCAAAQSDPDVVKTLAAYKQRWLSPVADTAPGVDGSSAPTPSPSVDALIQQTCSNNSETSDIGGSVRGGAESTGTGGGGVLKRQSNQNRNPLKARKVCFGATHFSDSDLRKQVGDAARDSRHDGRHDGRHDTGLEDAESRDRRVKLHDEAGSPSHTATQRQGSPWRSMSPVGDHNSPASSPRKTYKDKYGSDQGSAFPDRELENFSSGGKSQTACIEGSSKRRKKDGSCERHLKSDDLGIKQKSDDSNSRQRLDQKTKSGPGASESYTISPGGKGRSFLLRDSGDNASPQDSRDATNMLNASTRYGYSSPVGTKAKDSNLGATDHKQRETRFADTNLSMKPVQTAMHTTRDSRVRQGAAKTLAIGLSPTSIHNRTDNSCAEKIEKYLGHELDSEQSTSASESDGSERQGDSRGKVKVEQQVQKMRVIEATPKPKQGAKPKSPDGRAAVKTPTKPKVSTHISKSRETTASDTGRRRVAFSVEEGNSSQKSETRSRGSPAFASQPDSTKHDRGILKKPKDSGRPVKAVSAREEKGTANRSRLDQRSQAGDDESQTASLTDTERVQPRGWGERGAPHAETGSKAVRDARASSQEGSESGQSGSSSETSVSSEEGTQDGEDDPWLTDKLEQLSRDDAKMQNFMKEQKRQLEEEDRMNHLISKYANTRRGLSTLSKNFNNSETGVQVGADLSREDVVAVVHDMADGSGKADRLEFDAECRPNIDTGRQVCAPLGENPRQLKVCTVHPIPTDPTELAHNGNVEEPSVNCASGVTHVNRDATDDGHKQHLDAAQMARLRQFEVTAGQFVVCASKGVTPESRSREKRSSRGGESDAQSENRRPPVRCEWSAQRYSKSQTDANNNLSTLDTAPVAVMSGERTDPVRQDPLLLGAHLDSSARIDASSVNDKVVDCHSATPEHALSAHHQDQGLKDSMLSNLPRTKSSNRDSTSSLGLFGSTGKPCSCQEQGKSKDCSDQTNGYQVKDKPWLRDTGYECYSIEEKMFLPDPNLLNADTELNQANSNEARQEKPLKSCLKKRMWDDLGGAYEKRVFIDEAIRKKVSTVNDVLRSLDGEKYSDRQHVTEGDTSSTKACQTLTQRPRRRSSPTSGGCHADQYHRVPSKQRKHVQFQEPVRFEHCDGLWLRDSAGRYLPQRDGRNLNLSNNSCTADCSGVSDWGVVDLVSDSARPRPANHVTRFVQVCLVLKQRDVESLFDSIDKIVPFNNTTRRDSENVDVMVKSDIQNRQAYCSRILKQRLHKSFVICVVI